MSIVQREGSDNGSGSDVRIVKTWCRAHHKEAKLQPYLYPGVSIVCLDDFVRHHLQIQLLSATWRCPRIPLYVSGDVAPITKSVLSSSKLLLEGKTSTAACKSHQGSIMQESQARGEV